MAKKEALFDLIKSMSIAEKKGYRASYFKSKRPRHLILFDLMDKMEQYDVVLIKNKLKESNSGKLAELKRQTQENLVQFLLRNKKSNQPDELAEEMLGKGKLFEERGIYFRAAQLYLRTAELSQQMHDDTILLESLKRMRSIRGRWKQRDTLPEIDELQLRMVDASARIHELMKLRSAHYKYHKLIVASGADIHPEVLAEYDSELQSEWMLKAMNSSNFRNRIIVFTILAQHALFKNNQHLAFSNWKRAYAISKQIKKESRPQISTRIALLTNSINAAHLSYQLNEMKILIDELGIIEVSTSTAEAKRKESWDYALLGFHHMKGTIIPNLILEKIILNQSEQTRNPTFKTVINFKLSVYYLMHNNLNRSREFAEKALNSPVIQRLDQHLALACCLRIILFIEEVELDLLQNFLRNRDRQLTQQATSHQWEQALNVTAKILLGKATAEWPLVFKALHEELEPSRTSSMIDTFLDISSWAKSKWKKMPFSAVLAAKIND